MPAIVPKDHSAATIDYVPGMIVEATEEYEITKARLNPALYNSIYGIFWPNSYLYCFQRKQARMLSYKLFFSQELYNEYSSWGYVTKGDTRPGQISRFSISSTTFSNIGIDVNNIKTSDFYNFLDPIVSGHLVYMVPDSQGITFTYDQFAIPTLIGEAKWRSSGSSLTKEDGISVIKTSYYADEARTFSQEVPGKKYIKLVYNTPDPEMDDYTGEDGVITADAAPPATAAPGSGNYLTRINVAYNMSTKEVDKLKELYGTPISSDGNYSSNVYHNELTAICKQIYLTQVANRTVFLREGQPNLLNIRDLVRQTRYIEFNTNISSIINTIGITTTTTETEGGY